jgi:predicted transposase/invertase (TIGR01784 family)
VGREEGLEKGQEAATVDIARNALAEGLPIEVIQKITGLGLETIEQIAGSNDLARNS